MKSLTRTYWMPVIVALLLISAVGLWAWQTIQSFSEMRQERHRRFASGVFDTLQGTLRALGDQGRFRREQVERVLKSTTGRSPLHFVVIEQNGQRLVQVGDVPDVLLQPANSDELFEGNWAIFWRKVRFQDGTEEIPSTGAAVSEDEFDIRLGEGYQTLVLGVHVQSERHSPPLQLNTMLITFVTVLLFIGASTAAWIMTIRSALLTEQLEVERTRHRHLEELGLAAAGLAHETKNPLGIILGLAQRISGSPETPAESREMAEYIVDEVDKAAARVGGFMTFARQRTAKQAPVNVQALAAKVGQVLQADFDSAKVKLALDFPSSRVLADEEMLSQILVNLLLNSLHASAGGTIVSVRLETRGLTARLTVEDQGCGIEPTLLPDVFKPYVSGHSDGHGLGLSVVHRLVEQQGWTIRIDSQRGVGTRVVLEGMNVVNGGGEV